MSIATTFSNLLLVVLGALERSILCSLFFLVYIKLNHTVSFVKKLATDDILFFQCYAKTVAGELNPDLKENMNGHPSICHLIQIWIRSKELHFHGKWQSHFTQKSVSAFIFCKNFIWMKNWINITIYSGKFPNQCKEQTNSKVPSNILSLCKASFWIWLLSICEK